MNENKIDRASTIVFLIAVGVILLAALVLLGVSWLPFSMVRAWADKSAFDGSADFLTLVRFQKLVTGTRVAGSLLIGFTGALWIFRGRVLTFLAVQVNSFLRVFEDFFGHLKRVRADAGSGHLLVLGGLMLIAVAIRWKFIFHPMRYDEANTFIEYASRPLYLGLTYYSVHNNHLFHTFLVHLSYVVFGDAIWAVRLPAFIAGVFMVPASYLLFRALFDKYAGLLAAALMATSPILIIYSTNARGYTLTSLVFLLLMLLAVYLKKNREPAGWTLVAILTGLGLYAIPSMIFPLASLLVWWFLSSEGGESQFFKKYQFGSLMASGIFGGIFGLLLYLPALASMGLDWFAVLYFKIAPWTPLNFLTVMNIIFQICVFYTPPPVSLSLAVAFILFLFFKPRDAMAGVKLSMAVFLGSFILVALKIGLPTMRTWLFAVPVFLGVGAAGVAWILDCLFKGKEKIRAAVLAFFPLLVAISLSVGVLRSETQALSDVPTSFPDARAVAAFLKDRFKSDDGVFTGESRDEPLAYYFRREGLPIAPIFLYLGNRLQEKRRVWVVPEERGLHSLKNLLTRARLDKGGFGPPRLIRKFPVSSLYLVEKK